MDYGERLIHGGPYLGRSMKHAKDAFRRGLLEKEPVKAVTFNAAEFLGLDEL